MKNLFPQYLVLSDNDYKAIWENGLIVFDANVLLSLYRYQKSTREQFLAVLERLADRIWIPHQVALEFYRNRLNVIGEQIQRFDEVKKVVNNSHVALVKALDELDLKKRHSLINPEPLIEGYKKIVDDFLRAMDELSSTQQQLSGDDPLRNCIEKIFEGRVGEPFSSQNALDDLYKIAETRFKLKIPPGFMDNDKDKNAPDEYFAGGLIHKAKYGDFIVWNQLLDFAKKSNKRQVLFVTDDNKADWWYKLDVQGNKTIGPRPELIEEAKLLANIDSFVMYNSARFLNFANTFLKEEVSKEVLDEVRDVSRISRQERDFPTINLHAEKSVERWICKTWGFNDIEYPAEGVLDFIASDGKRRYGFDVRILKSKLSPSLSSINEQLRRLAYSANYLELDDVVVIYVAAEDDLDKKSDRLLKIFNGLLSPGNVRIIIGYINNDSGEFSPAYDVALTPRVPQLPEVLRM